MVGVNTEVASDSPNRGMPPQNVASLKAFLEAQREKRQKVPPAEREAVFKPLPEKIREEVESFIRDVPKIDCLPPDGKPKPEWTVFYGKTWNDAMDEADIFVRFNLSRESDPAHDDDKFIFARDAFFAAAKEAGRGEAADTAWFSLALDGNFRTAGMCTSSALIALMLLTSDLDFKDKEKSVSYAKARWEVYQKGYALHEDVDGKFFIFCKGAPPAEQEAQQTAK